MKIAYIVHSVTTDEVSTAVLLNGQSVIAKVPSTTVELLNQGFTHTFRFTDPADAAEALTWKVGQTINLTTEAVPMAPAEPVVQLEPEPAQVTLTAGDVGSVAAVLGDGQAGT